MTEILYTERIIQLILLNNNDSEIKNKIYKEYNVVLNAIDIKPMITSL